MHGDHTQALHLPGGVFTEQQLEHHGHSDEIAKTSLVILTLNSAVQLYITCVGNTYSYVSTSPSFYTYTCTFLLNMLYITIGIN